MVIQKQELLKTARRVFPSERCQLQAPRIILSAPREEEYLYLLINDYADISFAVLFSCDGNLFNCADLSFKVYSM